VLRHIRENSFKEGLYTAGNTAAHNTAMHSLYGTVQKSAA
jgi:hypothetical protein